MTGEDVVKRKETYAELKRLAAQNGMTASELRAWITLQSGKETTKELTIDDLVKLREILHERLLSEDEEIKGVGKNVEAATSGAIVAVPILSLPSEDTIVELFGRFQTIKRAVITDADKLFVGKDGKPCRKEEAVAEHIKKSGWRKLGLVCSVKIGLQGRERIEGNDENGQWHGWLYRVAAVLPSGRAVEAEGVCTSRNAFFCKRWDETEKKYKYVDTDEANLIRMAQTVAINRAISDLLGSGELSAEEVE
jgi:hypothetical protein